MKIAIYGYGNLGRGVECAVKYNPDAELVGFFTRRNPESLKTLTPGIPVYSADTILDFKDKIDVLILCGGSATDLPKTTPMLTQKFRATLTSATGRHQNPHTPRLYRRAGTPGSYLSQGSTHLPRCPRAATTHSGAEESAKGIRTRFEE